MSSSPPPDNSGGNGRMRPTPDGDQGSALASDQTASDLDQSASDADQGAVDADHSGSSRDQLLSGSDQRASDRDQAASDRELENPAATPAVERAHEKSRDERRQNTAERAAAAVLRTQTARERFAWADARDENSRLRDLAAEARDRSAVSRDRATGELVGPAAKARAHAATDRARAAADRERAATDRAQAAIDREHAHAALREAHLDELTGSYRRGMGSYEIEREIDRARRGTGRLMLAFVDVDKLKAYNDQKGHAAGDALLIDVVAAMRSRLRSYDPVIRFGGDEFVCALADADLADARLRFDEIQRALDQAHPGRSFSVGFAQLRDGDTVELLIARGDAALYEAKRGRGPSADPPGTPLGHRLRRFTHRVRRFGRGSADS